MCKDLFAPEAKHFIVNRHDELRKYMNLLERTIDGAEPELEELRLKVDTAMNEIRERIQSETDISELQSIADSMREIGTLAFTKLSE